MASRLRIQCAGGWYHLINRANLQLDVFAAGGDRVLRANVAGRGGAIPGRFNAAVPKAWIASPLRMGTPSSLRANLCRRASRIVVEGAYLGA
jgi:hypothetical protein